MERRVHGGVAATSASSSKMRWRLGFGAVLEWEMRFRGSRGCDLRRAAGVSWAFVPLSTGGMLGGDLG